MSRDLSVCSIDLAQLRAAFGSADKVLLGKVLDVHGERIADHDADARTHVALYLPLREAVRHVIEGNVDSLVRPSYQYELAVALIADTLGEALDADAFEECSEQLWDDIDSTIRRERRARRIPRSVWPTISELLKSGTGVSVPSGPPGASQTGHLTTAEVRDAWLAVQRLEFDEVRGPQVSDLHAEALRAVAQYREFLEEGAVRGVGLFFHC